jgi:ubiquinone/menaquinone biosynthesis C-methylase UbiE
MDYPAGSPFVDYQRVAARYEVNRAVPAEVLERWGSAVQDHLPGRPFTVLDLGAGTGLFSRVWRRWGAASVVAVEPSEAMGRTALANDRTVPFVRGVAEAIPLRSGCIDVVWISTAVHHFRDLGQAVTELARILRPGGTVLVRGYVPGRTAITFDHFPGPAVWKARYRSAEQLAEIFGAGGLVRVAAQEVAEKTGTFAEAADFTERMRDADTILTAMTDEQIEAGVRTLRAEPEREARSELTLLVFQLADSCR